MLDVCLALICGGAVLAGVLATLSCLNEGQLTEPAICRDGSSWYAPSLYAAVAIAVIGVLVGHVRRQWSVKLAAVFISLTVTVVTMMVGLRDVPHPPV